MTNQLVTQWLLSDYSRWSHLSSISYVSNKETSVSFSSRQFVPLSEYVVALRCIDIILDIITDYDTSVVSTGRKGMLGVLVQCTRQHSFAVRTVEALRVLTCEGADGSSTHAHVPLDLGVQVWGQAKTPAYWPLNSNRVRLYLTFYHRPK